MNLKDINTIQNIYRNMDSLDRSLVENVVNPQPTERLLDFTTETYPQYVPERVHAFLADKLDRVTRGEIKRLIVAMPPQLGKSELVSVRFPAFWLGRNPDAPVLLTSYGATLAEDKGRQVRGIVESPEYQKIFPKVTTDKESRAVALWHIQGHRGKMVSVGIGGPITGQGGLLGIVDDAVANYADAQSKTIRDNTWDWYRTTFRSRIWERGAIVVVMTRWHMDDLVGRILNSEGSAEWEIARIPAISENQFERDKANSLYNVGPGQPDLLGREPGESATPKRFSINAYLNIKRDIGSQGWNSLYQGAPTDVEGNRIKRNWLPIVDGPAPVGPRVHRVRAWDKAGSDTAESDFTVGTLMAYDEEHNVNYIEDVVRFQHSVGLRDKMILETAEADSKKYGNSVAIFHEQEPGSAGKDVAALINQMLRAYPVSSATATGSKEIRFEPFAKAAERLEIKVVQDTPEHRWNEVFIDELLSFPTGLHDDCADSAAYAYNQLATRKPKIVLTSY